MLEGLTGLIVASASLVGDDLFVTQCARLATGIKNGGQSILIKVNQSHLTETSRGRMAYRPATTAVMSHRSGETRSTIATRGRHQLRPYQTARWRAPTAPQIHQLLRIGALGTQAKYAGRGALKALA